MPRASFNPDRAKQGGGIESGVYKCVRALTRNIKTDYKPVQPAIILGSLLCDKDGTPVRDAEEIEISLAFGEQSGTQFSPGVGQSISDADPIDQGREPEAEGNTIFCETAGAQFNSSSGAIVFLKSLAKLGFPKETLDTCWAPNFVGLTIFINTLPAVDVNTLLGLRLNIGKTSDGTPFTYKVATKWLNPDYLGKVSATTSAAAAGNGTGAVATAAAAAASTMAAPVPAASVATSTKMSVTDILAACVAKLAKKKPGAKNKIKTKASLLGFLSNEFSTGKYVGATLAEFKKYVGDEDSLKDALLSVGAELGMTDEGAWSEEVTFPE